MSPAAIKLLHLELARAQGTTGVLANSYELHVPVLATGALDMVKWPSLREGCRVIRRSPLQPDCTAEPRPAGQGSLVMDFTHCDGAGTTLTQLYFDRLLEGSYVSLRESDGLLRTFYIAAHISPDESVHGFINR